MRDPLSHFVSGFTEAMTRSNIPKVKALNAGKPVPPYTIQRFMFFLDRLVTGHVRSVLKSSSFHIYPMSELALIQPKVPLPTIFRVLMNLPPPTRARTCGRLACHLRPLSCHLLAPLRFPRGST